jgi:thiol-disulfide isomerase/thioredoxin
LDADHPSNGVLFPRRITVASDDLLKSGPLVLTFYRGLWCPYCQKDLKSFAELINEVGEQLCPGDLKATGTGSRPAA